MTKEQIIEQALAQGFHQAAVIETDRILFDARFRPYCEENMCGQYAANYSCPPICGTPEQMKQRVLSHKLALVVQSEWEIEDFSQLEALHRARTQHNDAMFRVIRAMKADGHSGLMIGASGCMLCRPCKMASGEPCAHPDQRYSCMSAYCIHVKELSRVCGMNYDYQNHILPFFGMYVFD